MLVAGNKSIIEQELSIRIYSGGFSFSTPGGEKDVKVGDGESLAEALEKAFTNYSILRPDFDEVSVYANYHSTRIPLDEFRSEEAQAIYRLTFGTESLRGMNMHYEMLPALKIIEVFTLDDAIEQIILRHYPHAIIHSYFGQLMNRMWAYDRRASNDEKRLYASTCDQQLFVFAYENGTLRFANSFEAEQENDQLYFLLSVWKQLDLRQTKDCCVLIDAEESLQKELKRYIKNIKCV